MGNYKLGLVLNCWVQQRFPMDLSATEINKHSTALHLEVWAGLLKVFFIMWTGLQLNLIKAHYSILMILFINRKLKNFGPLLRWSSPLAPAAHHRTPSPFINSLSAVKWEVTSRPCGAQASGASCLLCKELGKISLFKIPVGYLRII